jgi:hypothetical protein
MEYNESRSPFARNYPPRRPECTGYDWAVGNTRIPVPESKVLRQIKKRREKFMVQYTVVLIPRMAVQSLGDALITSASLRLSQTNSNARVHGALQRRFPGHCLQRHQRPCRKEWLHPQSVVHYVGPARLCIHFLPHRCVHKS